MMGAGRGGVCNENSSYFSGRRPKKSRESGRKVVLTPFSGRGVALALIYGETPRVGEKTALVGKASEQIERKGEGRPTSPLTPREEDGAACSTFH